MAEAVTSLGRDLEDSVSVISRLTLLEVKYDDVAVCRSIVRRSS